MLASRASVLKPRAVASRQQAGRSRPSLAVPRLTAGRQAVRCSAAPTPPSHAPAGSELKSLSALTCVVPDSMLSELEGGGKPKAATVNASFILGVLKSPYGQAEFKSAVAGALAYEKCRIEVKDQRIACQLDKALVNVGSILAGTVEGRVSTEVDPRLSNEKDAIVNRVHILREMYKENKTSLSKVLFTIPATWDGLQAVKQLESEGIECHVTHCYSFIQAVAAAQAGASVIQMNIGRIDDWYKTHPGFIRDPTGPREDAGYKSSVDPGVKLMAKVYNYVKSNHPKTQLMASGIREKAQAIQLAGLDYMVISPQLMKVLQETSTLSGFNDGMHGDATTDSIPVMLSPETAAEKAVKKLGDVSQTDFVDELGYLGFDLLKAGVGSAVSNILRCEPFFMTQVGGQE